MTTGHGASLDYVDGTIEGLFSLVEITDFIEGYQKLVFKPLADQNNITPQAINPWGGEEPEATCEYIVKKTDVQGTWALGMGFRMALVPDSSIKAPVLSPAVARGMGRAVTPSETARERHLT